MARHTGIQWTDHTWPVTTGCDDESPGCLNCYAKPASYRMGLNPNPKVARAYGDTVEKRAGMLRWTGRVKTLPDRLDWPKLWKEPSRVFVGNMSDLFHADVPDEFIDAVFRVMVGTPRHTFQVLTKRADRMADYCSKRWEVGHQHPAFHPPRNIWHGVSVEDDRRAAERIPCLLKTPSVLRFVSVEPMLESIDLTAIGHGDQRGLDSLTGEFRYYRESDGEPCSDWGPSLDWVICGGESGPKARPFDLEWAYSLKGQCADAGAPFFMKQIGSKPNRGRDRYGRLYEWKPRDSHGGDPDEWPEDLRVREFPTVVAADGKAVGR